MLISPISNYKQYLVVQEVLEGLDFLDGLEFLEVFNLQMNKRSRLHFSRPLKILMFINVHCPYQINK